MHKTLFFMLIKYQIHIISPRGHRREHSIKQHICTPHAHKYGREQRSAPVLPAAPKKPPQPTLGYRKCRSAKRARFLVVQRNRAIALFGEPRWLGAVVVMRREIHLMHTKLNCWSPSSMMGETYSVCV